MAFTECGRLALRFDSDSRTEMSEDRHLPKIYKDDPEFKSQNEKGEFGEGEAEEGATFSPSVLPVHHAVLEQVGGAREASFWETVLCWISPYEEMREAAEGGNRWKAEKVLERFRTEWCVAGRLVSTLATVGAVAVIFAPGALFALEGFPRGALIVGATAALNALMFNTMFFFLYVQYGRGAEFLFTAKDMFDTYFLFSLTCHVPIFCVGISMASLMAFLLALAWAAWPTTVIVMPVVAGLLLVSELMVFGTTRLVNFAIWFKRAAWRTLVKFSGCSPPSNS